MSVEAIAERLEIEACLYREARLADEADYAGWESLLADDMHYWVPYGSADYDPAVRMSFLDDNHTRVATRIRQLQSRHRHAQTPPSPIRRVISHIEILARAGDEITVAANFVAHEHAVQARRGGAGRTTYGLRRTGDGFRLFRKVVELVDATDALPSIAFLL